MSNKTKKRRHPLAKETFLEGNRQRWAAIFVAIGLVVMGMTAYNKLKDPAPFLGYFTGIGVTFILGASASAVMGQYKIGSMTANQNVTEDIDVDETKNINEKYDETKDITIREEKLLKLERVDPKDIDEEAFDINE